MKNETKKAISKSVNEKVWIPENPAFANGQRIFAFIHSSPVYAKADAILRSYVRWCNSSSDQHLMNKLFSLLEKCSEAGILSRATERRISVLCDTWYHLKYYAFHSADFVKGVSVSTRSLLDYYNKEANTSLHAFPFTPINISQDELVHYKFGQEYIRKVSYYKVRPQDLLNISSFHNLKEKQSEDDKCKTNSGWPTEKAVHCKDWEIGDCRVSIKARPMPHHSREATSIVIDIRFGGTSK